MQTSTRQLLVLMFNMCLFSLEKLLKSGELRSPKQKQPFWIVLITPKITTIDDITEILEITKQMLIGRGRERK